MEFSKAVYNERLETRLVHNEDEEADALAHGYGEHPSVTKANAVPVGDTPEERRKIMNERDRAARVAESWPTGQLIAKEIAKAIRSGAEVPEPKPRRKPTTDAPAASDIPPVDAPNPAAKAVTETPADQPPIE